MDTDNVIAVIGVVLGTLGLFLPNFLKNLSAKKRGFRKAAAPILKKLTVEMDLISDGTYPFRAITEKDLHRLLPYTSQKHQKQLTTAFIQYIEAHRSAKTKHWHDEHPAEHAIFPMGFVVTNIDEVLEKMKPFQRELSR